MKILIAGEGGQGVQSIAEILARAANEQNKFTTYIPNFGVEQRGGVSIAFVQIGDERLDYAKFDKADIMVAMCNRAIEPIKRYLDDDTLFIYDSSFISNHLIKPLQGEVKKYLALPAKDLATQKGSTKISNIIFLGAISPELGEMTSQDLKTAMNNQFKSHPEFAELNDKAFDEGLKYAEDRSNQEFTGAEEKEIQKVFEDDEKSWERFPEYCKGCGLCLIVCPQKALSFSKELNFLGTNLPQVDINKCVACGKCQKICPDGAIKVTNKE